MEAISMKEYEAWLDSLNEATADAIAEEDMRADLRNPALIKEMWRSPVSD